MTLWVCSSYTARKSIKRCLEGENSPHRFPSPFCSSPHPHLPLHSCALSAGGEIQMWTQQRRWDREKDRKRERNPHPLGDRPHCPSTSGLYDTHKHLCAANNGVPLHDKVLLWMHVCVWMCVHVKTKQMVSWGGGGSTVWYLQGVSLRNSCVTESSFIVYLFFINFPLSQIRLLYATKWKSSDKLSRITQEYTMANTCPIDYTPSNCMEPHEVG